MKKSLLVFFAVLALQGKSQTVLVSENFTAYQGTAVTVPAGWTFNYHDFYSSTTSSGPSGPNSYKFSADTATIFTPTFSNADTVTFWYKGNSTDANSNLEILQTDDFITWFQLGVVQPIPSTGQFISFGLGHNIKQLKFIYHKSVGNCAFDDFSITQNATAINYFTKPESPFIISPNPSNGPVVIDFMNKVDGQPEFSIFNMIGNQLKDIPVEKINSQRYMLRFTNKQPGFYFLRIKTGKFIYTQRITITAMSAPVRNNISLT